MICKWCGKEFTFQDKRSPYCSKKCSKEARKKQSRDNSKRYYAAKEKSHTTKTCVICGAEFEVKQGGAVVCSRECQKEYGRRKANEYYQKHKGLIKKKKKAEKVLYKRACTECGKIFTTSHHTKSICSPECSEARRLRYLREYKQLKPKKDEVVDDLFEVVEQKPLDGKVLEKAQMTVDEYNKAHGTNYSYGQYVFYVESKGV